ncbi:MAG: rhomboid family intramembrane serine protease [Rudaea sp.]|nr:rhomboid family intramembrane serine protease [Rudaea sp.]
MPLHRRLSRANFPLMTVALICVNCFVYLFLQSGDERVSQQAWDYYQQSQLGKIEFPAYLDWLRGREKDAQRLEFAQAAPAKIRIAMIEADEKFLTALHEDRIIEPTRADYADWHEKREEFERIRASTFTARHSLRFSQFEPGNMFSSMFLHGGLEHLIGNMIFLAVLGLLVEGALGPWWFLALYLVGGFGGALTSLAWHWGDHGTALGASGAIAALMGAYCVLWGTRKVRVFYWFFVVFNYVRVPALTLLPIWFGWQVLNLWLNRGAHIGFDAHAGGILSGAALALALRQYGRVRDDFVEEDTRIEQREVNATAFEQALEYLGRLEIPKARELLERIDQDEPGRLPVLVALYRCARYSGTPPQLDAAAARALCFAAKTDAEIRDLKTVCDDYLKACTGKPRITADVLLRLVTPWLRIGEDAAAETLLHRIGEQSPSLQSLPAAWFTLALRTPESSPQRRARLEYVVQNYAQSDFAPKAKFLLQQA